MLNVKGQRLKVKGQRSKVKGQMLQARRGGSKVKGLYTGRFQPFHLGHLSAVKQALSETDFLYICVGSAQYDHEPKNPFTFKERAEMIRLSLEDSGISDKRYQILPLPDIHDNDKWPAYVLNTAPDFSIVFVGDDGIVKELFEKHTKIPVKIVKKEIPVCATDIRNEIKNNGDWKKYLTHSTAEYLNKMNAAERIVSKN